MKPDEVKALSDVELRIKAAELVGGWKWITTPRGGCRLLAPGPMMGFPEATGSEPVCRDGLRYVPDYLNDIAAAWGLAEECGISVIRVENEWWAGKFDGTNGDWWFDLGPIMDECAPRAITRAFVLAMTQGD